MFFYTPVGTEFRRPPNLNSSILEFYIEMFLTVLLKVEFKSILSSENMNEFDYVVS